MIDPRTLLPIPPEDAVVNSPISNTVAIVFTVIGGLSIIYAIFDWVKTRKPISLLLLTGGALAFFIEPMLDVLGACWHPVIGQQTVFTLMGRQIPLWLFPTYAAYFGIQPLLLYKLWSNGMKSAHIWLAFIVPVIVDIVLEETLMHWNVYFYYGHQPLILIKFPVWWAAANSAGVLAAALLTLRLVPRLKGMSQLVIPLITPFAYAGVFAVIALPAVNVINSDFPDWSTQLGGCLTVLIGLLIVFVFTRAFASNTRSSDIDIHTDHSPVFRGNAIKRADA